MRTWMLAAGAAALAMTAPALADPKDGGQRGGKGNAAKAERGGGDRGGQAKALRRGGERDRGQARSVRGYSERAGNARIIPGERRGADQRIARSQPRKDNARAVRVERIGDRDNVRELRKDRIRDRSRFVASDPVFRVRDFDRGKVRFRDIDRDDRYARRIGWADGCPPGLAKKAVPCLPPGQAAKYLGQPLMAASRFAALDPLPRSLRSLYYDDDDYYYRYGGGYLYRVDRDDDLISSIIPLFGAALIGQPLTSSFVNSYHTPSYYSSFYPNSPRDCYRYGYGYVYETDCVSGLVEDVIPTYNNGYGVGQVLPASYGYYNVPYAYRGYYSDNDDYYYRYAPGAIYRVDRETSLISAVASLLTGGLSVGQPLPMGYNSYNVPMAYRSNYYDTPDTWYRYNNGYIYSVDPTTQLVTAIVRAIA